MNQILPLWDSLKIASRSHKFYSVGEVTRRYIEHPGAVVFIPRLAADRFLLVKQYRFAADKIMLEFPAGTLEENESPLECAKREIAEETQYGANTWHELGSFYSAPGFCSEVLHAFLAEDLFPLTAKGEEEEMQVVEMSSKEIEQAIDTGAIEDSKTISIWYKAERRLKNGK